jgi:hypothetical protein
VSWLLQKIGVDPRHYFALLKLAWRMDMRTSKLGFGVRKKGRNPLLIFIFTILFYLVLGIFFADFSYRSNDLFFSATLVIGGIMFMLGGMMLVEYNTIIISPDDYHILGYMPVSSRTYFFAKSTNLLGYMLAFTTVLGGPTVIVHTMLKSEFALARGLLAFAAIFSAGLFVSLGAAVLYGGLLRIFSPGKLKNILAYLQFGVSFVIYGGYIFLPKLLDKYTESASIEKESWLLLLPTTWFASLIEIGYGERSLFVWTGAGVAIFLLVMLFRGAVSKISLDYAQRIAAFSIQSDTQAIPKKSRSSARKFSFSKIFRHPESRVVAKLVYAQFRHDNKFKLSILGVIPLLIVYFYLGLENGTLSDPFVSGTDGLTQFFLFFFALLMIPLILKQNLEMSDAFEAAWIFYATPASMPRLILAARNVLFLLLTLPSLVFIFILFYFYFATSLHALLHALIITAISFFFLQIIYLVNPKLPFAEPKARGGRARLFTALFFVLPAAGLGLLYLIIKFIYISPLRLGIAFAGFFVLIALTEKLSAYRIKRAMRTLAFET